MPAVERVNTDLKKQILQARLAKKMTQAQLAQARPRPPPLVRTSMQTACSAAPSPPSSPGSYHGTCDLREHAAQCLWIGDLNSCWALSSMWGQASCMESSVQACHEKPQVIQEYESGKAIPNPQVLSKLSRVLGVPLAKKGPKAAAKPTAGKKK